MNRRQFLTTAGTMAGTVALPVYAVAEQPKQLLPARGATFGGEVKASNGTLRVVHKWDKLKEPFVLQLEDVQMTYRQAIRRTKTPTGITYTAGRPSGQLYIGRTTVTREQLCDQRLKINSNRLACGLVC